MLSEYSSLLEVITAAYFSMCIDDVLKAIWTPQYNDKVKTLISRIKTPVTDTMKKGWEEHAQYFTDDIKKHMRVKSVFMLIVCVFLLMLSGLESNLMWLSSIENYSELLIRFSILCFILIIGGELFFNKYSTLFFDCVGIIVVLSLLFCFDFTISSADFITQNRAVFILLAMLFTPICWQVFLCWAYSSLYYGYLNELTVREERLYQMALQSFRIKEAAAAPEEYKMSVAQDIEAVKEGELDASTAHVLNTFVDRMEIICKRPSVYRLIWADIIYHWNRIFHPERVIELPKEDHNHIFRIAKQEATTIDEHKSVAEYSNVSEKTTESSTTTNESAASE